jgi:hypothetical protein
MQTKTWLQEDVQKDLQEDLYELLVKHAEIEPEIRNVRCEDAAERLLLSSNYDHRRIMSDDVSAEEPPDFQLSEEVFRRKVVTTLLNTHGTPVLALAAWRVLANFEPDSAVLKSWNARLLGYCDGVHTLDDLFRINGAFGNLLRRDMRVGIFKFLYIWDIASLLGYLVYRVCVMVIFALGFLFELMLDREFAGGVRTALRGFLMLLVIGILYARVTTSAYSSSTYSTTMNVTGTTMR